MNETSLPAATRVMDSSVVARVVRRVVAGSILCAILASTTRRLRRTRERIGAGLGGAWSHEQAIRASEQLEALAADSRVMAALSSCVTAPWAAWHEASVKRLLDPILDLDLPARFRLTGFVLVIAVLTHTALLAVLGVPVEALGWSVRAGLVVASLIVIWRPRQLAAAWRDRTAQQATSASRSSWIGEI